jgi:phage FluMu protein Com
MEDRSTDTIQVKCPFCKQRLFDIEKDAEGVVSIKCSRCRAVVSVSMHHQKYKCAEKISAK